MNELTPAVRRILSSCTRLSDDELLTLHRLLSATASHIRAADPEYQRRYSAGMASPNAVRQRELAQQVSADIRRARLKVVQ